MRGATQLFCLSSAAASDMDRTHRFSSAFFILEKMQWCAANAARCAATFARALPVPLTAPAAPAAPATYNGMALELVIRAPTNAKAFSFDFYTSEYTHWVCSGYNDGFVALLFSSHADVPANHNIAFDSQQNSVSVNNAFVEVLCAIRLVARGYGLRRSRRHRLAPHQRQHRAR
jgi:hypothetical protein